MSFLLEEVFLPSDLDWGRDFFEWLDSIGLVQLRLACEVEAQDAHTCEKRQSVLLQPSSAKLKFLQISELREGLVEADEEGPLSRARRSCLCLLPRARVILGGS
jgi:hypothetical protein